MRHVVLYRRCQSLAEDDAEILALKDAGFVYLKSRTEVQSGDLVIARFSCVPFYNELANDLEVIGATLINNKMQHNYIADLQNWVIDLAELTPTTWNRIQDLPEEGPFFLKGETNSRKGLWNTHAFAKDKKEAIEVYGRLLNDSLIGMQQIYIRKFIPLHTFMDGINGQPITKEFRFFILDDIILTGAFYWASDVEDLGFEPNASEVPKDFLEKCMERIRNSEGSAPRAYCLDVGITQAGEPIVIELNDLQMSGLSMNDPSVFYKRLKEVLDRDSQSS